MEIKVSHPYIDEHFDFSYGKRYLIIGTFPPNPTCTERRGEMQFFYGNTGSLWSIIDNTRLYPGYNFTNAMGIKKWLNDFTVGVTDVLKSCKRRQENECSTEDKHLIIEESDLDDRLKKYILKFDAEIKKIFFTSGSVSKSSNSAYYWFKKLMGIHFNTISKGKLIKLPSPSGNAYTSLYRGKKEQFGLIE